MYFSKRAAITKYRWLNSLSRWDFFSLEFQEVWHGSRIVGGVSDFCNENLINISMICIEYYLKGSNIIWTKLCLFSAYECLFGKHLVWSIHPFVQSLSTKTITFDFLLPRRAEEIHKRHCEERFVIDTLIFQKGCERLEEAKAKVEFINTYYTSKSHKKYHNKTMLNHIWWQLSCDH